MSWQIFGEPDSPWFAPRFAEIVEPIRKLVGAFGPWVTFTRFVAPEAPAGAWVDYYERWPFALQPPGSHAYGLVDDLAGLAADAGPTLDAPTFGDACAGADDTSHQRALEVMRLYEPLIRVVTVSDILAPAG
ncbi:MULTISPECIES: hypothetical protein [unclassified Nonomuraea]|uniref:hypothetical protein n=1 Tax=unclassified Nonomuraea TaxID=2593643 RepID=UPI0033C99FBD